jgi:hypothetical protein
LQELQVGWVTQDPPWVVLIAGHPRGH